MDDYLSTNRKTGAVNPAITWPLVPPAATASLTATEQEMRVRIVNTHTDRHFRLYILDWQGAMEQHTFESPASPLQDTGNNPYFNVGSGGGSGYQIPIEDVMSLLKACWSWKNLAACLASKTFSRRERAGSNCRGKTALHRLKVKAIYDACLKHYPLQRLETSAKCGQEDEKCSQQDLLKDKGSRGSEKRKCLAI